MTSVYGQVYTAQEPEKFHIDVIFDFGETVGAQDSFAIDRPVKGVICELDFEIPQDVAKFEIRLSTETPVSCALWVLHLKKR